MAGVTDVPFREVCLRHGAGITFSEMVTSETRLWNSRKSQQRLRHPKASTPRAVQIAGSDPTMMAEAARQNVALGAQVVDINMGCPAKKVCRREAGSALLRDELLVAKILNKVVHAVEVPVTLKIRTGWDPAHRNGVTIARIAEQAGIAAIAVHGRTRACRFKGAVEYDTIASIVDSVSIPVFANGDIITPEQARYVLHYTGAAAVMIGRGAQGNPWIFREINSLLASGRRTAPPGIDEKSDTIEDHVASIHKFYGAIQGVRLARKHIGWYLDGIGVDDAVKKSLNLIDAAEQQLSRLRDVLQSVKLLQAQAA